MIYRDLKPENILLAADGHIKLADFGLAKEGVNDQGKTKSFCGSPAYLSPEMLSQKGTGKASDIYGIGTVFYELLIGEPPYYSDDIPTMYKQIKEGTLKFPGKISDSAKNLIKVKKLLFNSQKLLDRNPKTRIGVNDKNEIKNDPFFSGYDWNKVISKGYQPPLTKFEEDMN